MSASWQRELWALLALFLIAATIGLAIGHFAATTGAVAALYFGWHAVSLIRFYRWLTGAANRPAPVVPGVWSDLFYAVDSLQRRHQRGRQRLTALLQQFQASAAALPDGAVVLDRVGRVVWFNDAATDLLGLRMPQDIGQRLGNLVRHPNFTAYLRADNPSQDVVVPAPGPSVRELSLRLIPYGDGQRLLIARDISEAKRTERIRRDFVANASHELRTPLTVLRGYLGMMNDDAGERGPLSAWNEPLADMQRQTTRMERIIADMLALARLEQGSGAGEKECIIDADALVRRLGHDAAAVSTDHTVLVASTPGLGLYGRSGELESAFSNLIHNAIQHTPPGTTVRIRWERAADGAEFEVADDGPGIDAKDIPRLTERFFRVDESRSRTAGGTGLGLAIVKHVLERHDGELVMRSERGTGASFTCRFPPSRVRRITPATAEST